MLDLARPLTPERWLPAMKLDLTRQGCKLDKVGKVLFGSTSATPLNVDAHVEISD